LSAREGKERDEYANTALSIGVMCLQRAGSHVDTESLKQTGASLIERANEAVSARGKEIITQLESLLREHFDPSTGVLPTRIRSLVEKDGELERLMSSYIGTDDSRLARSLAQYVGEE